MYKVIIIIILILILISLLLYYATIVKNITKNNNTLGGSNIININDNNNDNDYDYDINNNINNNNYNNNINDYDINNDYDNDNNNLIGGDEEPLANSQGNNSYVTVDGDKLIKYYFEHIEPIPPVYDVINDNIIKIERLFELDIYKYLQSLGFENIPKLYASECSDKIENCKDIFDKIKFNNVIFDDVKLKKLVMEYISDSQTICDFLLKNGLVVSSNLKTIISNDVDTSIMIKIYSDLFKTIVNFMNHGIIPNDIENNSNVLIKDSMKIYYIDFSHFGIIKDYKNNKAFQQIGIFKLFKQFVYNGIVKNFRVFKHTLQILANHKNCEYIIKESLKDVFNESQINEMIYVFKNYESLQNKNNLISMFLGDRNRNVISLNNLMKETYTKNNYKTLCDDLLKQQFVQDALKIINNKYVNSLRYIRAYPKECNSLMRKSYDLDKPHNELLLSSIYGYTLDKLISDMIKLIPTDVEKGFYVDPDFPFIGYLEGKDNRIKIYSKKYLKLSLYNNSKSYSIKYLNTDKNYLEANLQKIDIKELEPQYVIIPEDYNVDDCVLNIAGCIDDTHFPLFAPNIKDKKINVEDNINKLIKLINSSEKHGKMYTRNPNNKIKIVYPEKKNNDLVEVDVKYIELKTFLYTVGNVNLNYSIIIGY